VYQPRGGGALVYRFGAQPFATRNRAFQTISLQRRLYYEPTPAAHDRDAAALLGGVHRWEAPQLRYRLDSQRPALFAGQPGLRNFSM
jgi:hypothetical protein